MEKQFLIDNKTVYDNYEIGNEIQLKVYRDEEGNYNFAW